HVGLVDQLKVSPLTMSFVFSFIVLLSGLIAFMLGVAEAHPAVAAYRQASEARDQAEESYLEAVRAHAEAQHSEPEPEAELILSYRRQAGSRQAAVWADYQAAQLAYLDTVALETHEPTMTQAASAAIQDEPLPPELASWYEEAGAQ